MPSLNDSYHWVDDAADLDWSVAVIQGQMPDMVVATYGGDPTQPQHMTYAQAKSWRNEHFNDHGLLLVKQLDQAVVVIEPNGWASSVAELARRLSANGGHFFSVYWSPTAFQVLEAIDGQVTALFDPVYVDPNEPEPRDGERYPSWLRRDEFQDDHHLRSACMTLMEAQGHVRVEQEWLKERSSAYAIPDPNEFLGGAAEMRRP